MNSDEIISKKNNNKKNSKNIFNINDNSNYCLNLFQLIKKINKSIDVPSQSKDNEYLLNLLLISPKLNDSNKITCLLLLYYLYRKDKKNQNLLDYLFLKICKLSKKIELYNDNLIQKLITFPESKNFFYSWEYLTHIKQIIFDEKKTEKNFKNLIKTIENDANDKVCLYLEENSFKFNDFKLVTDEQLKRIKIIIEQLLSCKYEIKNDNNSFIYLIERKWIYKLKAFIDPYISSREQELVTALTESAFNIKNVTEHMKNHAKFDSKKNSYQVYFPGPIYNLGLLQIKNYWYDPVNLEENDIIKKDLKLNEDYYLINMDDWILLKSIFKDSNEMRRKNINDEILRFKVVIIEPRLRTEKYKYLLNIKDMQINANKRIKELKNKIIRCINYQIDSNINNYDDLYANNNVEFFVINKQNKNLLIELFISLLNNSKTYESLYFKKIKIEDNENSIKNIFNNYFDKDSEILVAEIIPKNEINYINQIINIKENSKNYICSVCGELLNIFEKYNCNFCNLSLFCSYECAKISGEHINLHESLYKFYSKNFDLKSFFQENMTLHKENQKDLVTFPKDKINNYSCINSIIHCLSFSSDLTKYILSKQYINDINISDFILNKKLLIHYYYELMAKMWKDEGYEKLQLYYQNFLKFLLNKLDYDPDDKSTLNNVREILLAILNIFDKELNRATNLYNIDLTKGNNIPKKNSIITDLFYGILQTTFSCSKCGNVSIIFDFFRYLLLPIPKKNSNLIIKYFNDFECKFLHYTYDDNSNIKELKDKVLPFLSDKISYIVNMMSITDLIEITAFDVDDEKILTEIAMYNSIELVQFDKNKIVTKIYLTDKKEENNEKTDKKETTDDEDENKDESDLELNLSKIYKDNDIELVFYEKSVFEEPCINIYIYPFLYNEKDKYSVLKERLYNVYPIAFSANLSLVLENFEHAVNVKLRNLLIDFYKEESEKGSEEYIELVYPHYFGNSSIYSSFNCLLCKERAKNTLFCPLFPSMDKDQTIKDLIQKFEYPKQPIIFLAKSNFYDTNKKYYLNMNTFQPKKESKRTVENKLDIYNCFQLYTKKETVEGVDWFCESCNGFQICEKQLTIYNLPVYLIIQIDRFAIKKLNVKNFVDNTLINFPINNLNLNKYVEGPDKDKINYNYSLYAVIYKDISSRNDFTYCVCKNGKSWAMFKENKISTVTELINKNVHFLMYKREDAQK